MIATGDLRPSRALGQNFVADQNTVRRIARLAELEPGQPVVEIGAGLGALTLALAEAGAGRHRRRDRPPPHCHPAGPRWRATASGWWRATPSPSSGRPCSTDRADRGEPPAPWVLVANLPYNVAVPVIVRVLEEAPMVASMLVMVQREVGERLAAVPGTKAYGAVSVKVAYHATARLVGRVPPAVFVPRPSVESVLVRIVRRETVAVDPAVADTGPAVHGGAGRLRPSSQDAPPGSGRCRRSGRLRRRRRRPAGPGRRTVDRRLGKTGGVRRRRSPSMTVVENRLRPRPEP